MQKLVAGKGGRAKRADAEKVEAGGKRQLPRAIYALQRWSIERRERGWYIGATQSHLAGTGAWHGPYRSIENACQAIGKKLTGEAAERYQRHCKFHGVKDELA